MLANLLSNSYFALFVIISLGFLLGRVNFKGISLDVSAVIFVALLFGHYGIVVPKELSDFGMVLFIFTIGIQAGPGFFDSFKAKGKKLVILGVVIILSATIAAIGMMFLFGFDVSQTVGLLTGALTSTPGLATAKELAGDGTAVSYGIAYPFGVIGVILFVKLLPKMTRISISNVEKELAKDEKNRYPSIESKTFKVTHENLFSRSLADLDVANMTGVVISKVLHDGVVSFPTAATVLYENDIVKAVGTEDALNRFKLFVGEESDVEINAVQNLELVVGLVSNKSIVNKRIGTLNIQQNFGCTITRVRRSSIDISPTPSLKIKMGDKLTIVGDKARVTEFLAIIGNNAKQVSDTDFLPISLGIILGVLFGKISLELGNSFTFSFGLTGGILVIALILSAIGKTGPFVWTMSGSANQLLRQIGLLLFLAGVGTSAGTTMVETIMQNGWSLFLAGFVITLVPMIVATIINQLWLKINILELMGGITGGMTSTPGLAAADSMTDTSNPSIAYATVYPVAMVLLILAVQFIAGVF